MQLDNSFTVPVGLDDTWQLFQDIGAVAPCMPGAVLDTVEGDSFTGRVGVKVGAVRMSYRGRGTVRRDEAEHAVVLELSGSETRGSGTASAEVAARLTPDGDRTRVTVRTDLALTGRPAQFGRGILAEVADGLVQQFAARLAEYLSTHRQDGGAPGTALPGPGTSTAPAPAEPDAVDLGAAVLPVLARRAARPAAALAGAGLLAWLLARLLSNSRRRG
ncbi:MULTISPECIES: SRPBCC family protein [Streptomyces]|uniref:SRPBCC family protein n=1 Tax=Streptomyces TaxID=1883 RepID=UPI0004CA1168|nr:MULTISPECIES: SRPBCC family protein [Streptomyces]